MEHYDDGGAHDHDSTLDQDTDGQGCNIARSAPGRQDLGHGRDDTQHDGESCTSTVSERVDRNGGQRRQPQDQPEQSLRMGTTHGALQMAAGLVGNRQFWIL
eukprot:688501-Heterocapsa_arctica.AAC.1